MIECPCGCRLESHSTGAYFNVHRCDTHKAAQNPEPDLEYYRRIGVMDDNPPHVREFVEALGELDRVEGKDAFEIGCGVSPYARMIQAAGYLYFGADLSKIAIREMRRRYPGLFAFCADVETLLKNGDCDLVLAAHVLEHVKSAPQLLEGIHRSLNPGGLLYLIIPDDCDQMNPDHHWFFSTGSITRMVQNAGLVVESLKMFKRVEYENFLYLKAKKP